MVQVIVVKTSLLTTKRTVKLLALLISLNQMKLQQRKQHLKLNLTKRLSQPNS